MDMTPAQEVNEVEVLAGHSTPLKENLFAFVSAFTSLNCPGSQQTLSQVHAQYVTILLDYLEAVPGTCLIIPPSPKLLLRRAVWLSSLDNQQNVKELVKKISRLHIGSF